MSRLSIGRTMRKLRHQPIWTAVLAVFLVALVGTSLSHLTYAATGSMSLSPASGTATVGSTLIVTLHENSGTDATVGVDAFVDYSSNLQFVSASTAVPFTIAPPDSPSGNSVEIVRGYAGATPPTGDQVVSVLTFNVISAGTGTVSFETGSGKSSISPASGGGSLLTSVAGGSYTLNATSGSSGSSGSSGGTTSGSSGSAPAAPSSTSKSTSVSVTPTKTAKTAAGAALTVPNNGSVAVNTPVSVQPATVQTDGVKKIEYYLNGKLVDTETKAPYKYNIDTTQYKNGTYKLASKTYYDNGMVKQASQNIMIRNTANRTSLWLYVLIVGLLLLIIVGINLFRHLGGPLAQLMGHGHVPVSTGPAVGGWPIVGGDREAEPDDPDLKPIAMPDEPAASSTAAPAPGVAAPTAGQARHNVPAPGTTVTPIKVDHQDS